MDKTSRVADSNKSRTVFTLDSPFSPIEWPKISIDDQTTILDLLCRLLAPIGECRSEWTKYEETRRSKKRKRDNAQVAVPASAEQSSNPRPTLPAELKPRQEMSMMYYYVSVGLNQVTSCLEVTAKEAVPDTWATLVSPRARGGFVKDTQEERTPSVGQCWDAKGSSNGATDKPLAAVFVCRSSQPALLHAHLPLLTFAASLSHPGNPTALVALPKGAEARLSIALGLPRAGVIGIRCDAPGAESLIGFIQGKVQPVSVNWLTTGTGLWRHTVIKAARTSVGERKTGKKGSRKPTKEEKIKVAKLTGREEL